VSVCPVIEHDPGPVYAGEIDHETPAPAGRVSLKVTPVSVRVPDAFLACTVKPIVEPALTLAASAVLLSVRFGGGFPNLGPGGPTVGVGVIVGVAVFVGVAVGVDVGVDVEVGVIVGVPVFVGVGLAVDVDVAVDVAVAVDVGTRVLVAVAVGVSVAVADGGGADFGANPSALTV